MKESSFVIHNNYFHSKLNTLTDCNNLFSAPCSPIVSASRLPRGDGLADIYHLVSMDTQVGSTATGLGVAVGAGRLGSGPGRRVCLQRQPSGWRPGTESELSVQRRVRVVKDIGKASQNKGQRLSTVEPWPVALSSYSS